MTIPKVTCRNSRPDVSAILYLEEGRLVVSRSSLDFWGQLRPSKYLLKDVSVCGARLYIEEQGVWA